MADRYKLVHNIGEKRSGSYNRDLPRSEYELYDLVSDPYETENIAKQFPEIVKEMKIELDHFVESCERSDRGADYNLN